ncbi:MAG: hypothetical protein HGB19_09545 [Chlorobiales bacterium]|nr:hypothetical protein [Chlorobiales bacterium]
MLLIVLLMIKDNLALDDAVVKLVKCADSISRICFNFLVVARMAQRELNIHLIPIDFSAAHNVLLSKI